MAKKTESGLPRDLERAGSLSLAFVNTAMPGRDDRRRDSTLPPKTPLATYPEVVAWCQRMGVLAAVDGERLIRRAAERPEAAAAAHARLLELRSALGRLFTALAIGQEAQPGDLAILNAVLPRRQIVPDGDGFRVDIAGNAEALDRMLGPIAQSAAEVLIAKKRLCQCAAKGCFRLFLSHHSQRRWCDMNTCGNRAKGRRIQRRKERSRGFTPWYKRARPEPPAREPEEGAGEPESESPDEERAPDED